MNEFDHYAVAFGTCFVIGYLACFYEHIKNNLEQKYLRFVYPEEGIENSKFIPENLRRTGAEINHAN
jgi:hypothetical protein